MEFRFRLAGEARDDTGGNGDIRHDLPGSPQQVAEGGRRGLARHALEGCSTAALQRKMQVTADTRVFPQAKEIRVEVPRLERGQPDAGRIRFAEDYCHKI